MTGGLKTFQNLANHKHELHTSFDMSWAVLFSAVWNISTNLSSSSSSPPLASEGEGESCSLEKSCHSITQCPISQAHFPSQVLYFFLCLVERIRICILKLEWMKLAKNSLTERVSLQLLILKYLLGYQFFSLVCHNWQLKDSKLKKVKFDLFWWWSIPIHGALTTAARFRVCQEYLNIPQHTLYTNQQMKSNEKGLLIISFSCLLLFCSSFLWIVVWFALAFFLPDAFHKGNYNKRKQNILKI